MGPEHARPARLSRDTDADAEARQIAAWRAMTPAALARLVDDASQAVRDLAMAGLKARYPGATDRELTVRFAAPQALDARGPVGILALTDRGAVAPDELTNAAARRGTPHCR